MDIYQEIWDADQEGNGIKPVLHESHGYPVHGYVVVNEQPNEDRRLSLFKELVIPDSKKKSYELCRKLFNNYALSPSMPEIQTPEEENEIHKLLEYIVDSKPMMVAREYMHRQTGRIYSSSSWYKILNDIWFTRFTQSSGRDLSAFEHIIIGEQKGSKVSGYHFWYKYYLDDSFNLLNSDDIEYLGLKGMNQEQNMTVPEVSTISFKWNAFDYDEKKYRPLYKTIGGFFNGCSIEGLMALGTVRFLGEGRAPKEAVINGALYKMKVYRSINNQHMRTFYPEFVHITTPAGSDPYESPTVLVSTPGATSTHEFKNKVKIISALVNPIGADPGFETITLLNVSPEEVDISGWKLMDRNNNSLSLDTTIQAGETVKIELSGISSPQLSNKGGLIKLEDKYGDQIDKVSYSKEQVQNQGWSVVF